MGKDSVVKLLNENSYWHWSSISFFTAADTGKSPPEWVNQMRITRKCEDGDDEKKKVETTILEFARKEKNSKKDPIKFTNFVAFYRLKRAAGATLCDSSYGCGLNAINMSLRMWGYNKQMKLSEYSHMYAFASKNDGTCWGMTGDDMWKYNIKKVFNIARCAKYCDTCGPFGDVQSCSWIDKTDFSKNNIMMVTGAATKGHYIMVVGVSTDKQWYLVTDHSLKVWLISYSNMKEHDLFHYRSNYGWSVYDVRSQYRLG